MADLIIDASGKQNKLVAGSNITIDETNPLAPIISSSGGGGGGITIGTTPITSGTDGRILFQKAGNVGQDSNLFWDDTNKRLGIGVVPEYPLDMASNSSTNAAQFRVRSINDFGNIRFTSFNGTELLGSIGFQREGVGTGNLRFFTSNANNNQERFRVTPLGLIGVGQTVPTARFHLKAFDATSSAVFRVENSAGSGDLFNVLGNGNVGIGITPSMTSGFVGVHIKSITNVGAELRLDTTDADRRSQVSFLNSGTLRWQIFHDNTDNSLKFRNLTAPTLDTVTILKTGNVGLNITSPTAKIHIIGGTATAGTAPIKLTAGTNLTTPENGAFEFDGTSLYFTVGGVRKTVNLV